MVILIVGLAFLVFMILTFRTPAPKPDRLVFFLLLLASAGALAYLFVIRVLEYNPNPTRVAAANRLTDNKLIDLTQVVPGVYDLDYLYRIDTDWDEDEEIKEEWLAFYQYDVHVDPEQQKLQNRYEGPFGAAIYDLDDCRPPAVLSFELVPVSYDYLGENGTRLHVENIIAYQDPLSASKDRPEVIITGLTRGAATDLNIFRKTGVRQNCLERQNNPGQAFPNPFQYQNVGSFRANYLIRRDGHTVSTFDRAPFERSQITIRREYRPENGSYFEADGRTLIPPVEQGLAFGATRPIDDPQSYLPKDVLQVYYPEKAVLAFYLNLTKDNDQLETAKGYLSSAGQDIHRIKSDQFGIAMPRDEMVRVLVLEIRYNPEIQAERLHKDREVTVTVVGVDAEGHFDYSDRCQVTWTVVGVEDPTARPYGCEWRLETYWSPCAIGK